MESKNKLVLFPFHIEHTSYECLFTLVLKFTYVSLFFILEGYSPEIVAYRIP